MGQIKEFEITLAILKGKCGCGGDIGAIIDDYLDLVTPVRRYSERRFEISSVYEWFRELCGTYNVPGWSASQARRSSLSKDIITMEDIAEDIGKANISDVIIALCQSHDEYYVNQCRLFMAKVRDGEALGAINAKYYGSKQAIVTTGFVKHNKDTEDV